MRSLPSTHSGIVGRGISPVVFPLPQLSHPASSSEQLQMIAVVQSGHSMTQSGGQAIVWWKRVSKDLPIFPMESLNVLLVVAHWLVYRIF